MNSKRKFNFKLEKFFIDLSFISIFSVLLIQTSFPSSKKNIIDNEKNYISYKKENYYFAISELGKSTPLYISSEDYPGVIFALKDLQNDIKNVTGIEPALSIDTLPKSNDAIIVGTLDKSPIIDKLVTEKKINVEGIKNKWEATIIQVIDNPVPGINRALVIAGSDKRGTIYGIYDVSEKIGVSPWYWWADVPVKKHSGLYLIPGTYKLGPPAVKYRGIFINDEAPSLTGWAYKKYGGLNHQFYEKVFELLLRLKANYLWPAMWNNNFDDDDSLNQNSPMSTEL
jgi:hypothetical protein